MSKIYYFFHMVKFWWCEFWGHKWTFNVCTRCGLVRRRIKR
jgi:hypothetical protein